MQALDVRRVPEAVRAAVCADAESSNTSMNATIVRALATEYQANLPLREYPYQGCGDGDHWLVRLPDELHGLLRAHAKATDGTMTGMLLLQLQRHYRLPTSLPTARHKPGEQLPPEVVQAARSRNGNGESVRSLAKEFGVNREKLRKAMREA